MPKDSPPFISNVQVSPASGPGGTVFFASVTASDFPPLKLSYQWRLDGADIAGATGVRHIASAAGQLTVLVTAIGDFGSASRESAAAQVGPALAAPAITEARIVPGAGVVGDRFAAIAAATGVPAPELSYQWLRDGVAICGATAATYTAVSPGALSVRITGRNTEGSDGRDSNVVVLAPGEAAPTVTAVEIHPADGRVGETFTVVAEAAGVPAPELGYQWLLDGAAIAGVTGASHVPGAAGLLTVRATATNAAGSDSRESAGVSITPASTAPRVASIAVLPGSGRVGDTFTATAVVSGTPEPDLAFEWLLDGQPIPAATSASYRATAAGTLRVRVVATNSEGTDSAESGGVPVEPAFATPTITDVSIAPPSGPVGTTFEASVTVSGNPAPVLSYQWLQDGEAIAGASGASHVAGAAGLLAVQVTATNSAGSDTGISSVPVLPLTGAPVPEAGPHTWNENVASGLRTFDAAARFSVPGDPIKASVTYELVAGGGGDGPFVTGVFEGGVFVGGEDGYVSIDPVAGVVSIDTDVSGPLDGVTVVVRASNGAGFGDLAIALTVAAEEPVEWSPATAFPTAVAVRWFLPGTEHAVLYVENSGTPPGTPADTAGDRIGSVLYDIPAAGYLRSSSAGTNRPTLGIDGGIAWAEFAASGAGNGVLQSDSNLPLRAGWHVFVAVTQLSSANPSHRPLVGIVLDGTNYMAVASRRDQRRLSLRFEGTSFEPSISGVVIDNGTNGVVPEGEARVLGAYFGEDVTKGWVGNSLLIDDSENVWGGAEGSGAKFQIHVDHLVSSTRSEGLFYAACAVLLPDGAEMSSEDRTNLVAYLASRMPS